MWSSRFKLDLTGNKALPAAYPTKHLWPRSTIINNQREYYVDPMLTPDVFLREPEGLTLRARRRTAGENFTGQGWLSGMFTGYGQADAYLKAGARERVTFTGKLPVGVGAWPAFWLNPVIIPAEWPADEPVLPEIDVMEALSFQRSVYYSTVHTRDNPQGVLNQDQYEHNCPDIDLTEAFHQWGYERVGDLSRFWFDGQVTKTFVTPADLRDRDLFFIVNLAVGGNWSEQWSNNWPPDKEFYRFQIASVEIERWQDTDGEDTVDDSVVEVPPNAALDVLLDPSHPNHDVANKILDLTETQCECLRQVAMDEIKKLQ